MKSKDPADVLDEISREQIRQGVHLLPGIKAKIEQGNRIKLISTMRTGMAVLLLSSALLIAFFAAPGVASAIRRLIGYIPGQGSVNQSIPLRVLAAPVSNTRDGYTITVESALLDAAHTVIRYKISGAFPTWAGPTLQPVMCQEYPSLRLADGTALTYPSRTGGQTGGVSSWEDVFRPLPADENSAMLVLPCLAELPAGEGPLNWEIPLAFAPAPPELTVIPVVEPAQPQPTETIPPTQLSTAAQFEPALPPTAGPSPTAAAPDMPPATQASAADNWLQITLEGVANLKDGYYLQTMLRWQIDPDIWEVQYDPEAAHLYDAAGQEVPIWPEGGTPPMSYAGQPELALNLETGPIANPGPARLVIDSVIVRQPANASFAIDVGDAPQPGQTWEIHQDIDIDGRTLRVVSAEYVQGQPGDPPWMMLYLASDSGIHSLIAMDTEHEIMGTGGSPDSAVAPFRAGWRYPNGFPKGTIKVEITSISVTCKGPWSLEWTPEK